MAFLMAECCLEAGGHFPMQMSCPGDVTAPFLGTGRPGDVTGSMPPGIDPSSTSFDRWNNHHPSTTTSSSSSSPSLLVFLLRCQHKNNTQQKATLHAILSFSLNNYTLGEKERKREREEERQTHRDTHTRARLHTHKKIVG